MKLEQVLICLDKKEGLRLDILTDKQKELVALGRALMTGNKKSIASCVKNALDKGSSREEILTLLSWMIKNGPSLNSILYLLKTLNYEETERREFIDVVHDCRL